jgi:salicylate hydroxylase
MSEHTQMLIVGGGIGGLALALVARQQGYEVQVLEQAPELSEIGAGLQVSANAMWVLEDLGLGAAVRAIGVASEATRFHQLEDGRPVFRTELGVAAARRYGQEFTQIHRADLLGVLADALPSELVRLDSKVVEMREEADRAVVVLSDGSEFSADVVVGADGIKSRVRDYVAGVVEPEFTGMLGWRAMLTRAQVHDLGIDHSCDCWLGSGRSVVTYWLRRGELFNIIGFVPAAEVHRESWSDLGDAEELRASFAGSCELVERILGKVDTAFLTGVYYHQPAENWSRGRFVLVGDAAHATVPYLAQGACQAIEDAAVLPRLLRRHDGDHAAAFAEFEARRKPRTSRVQSVARSAERWWHEADPVQIAARDGMYRGITRLDPLGETVWSWLYEHDPITALDRPIGDTRGLSTARPGLAMARPQSQRAADAWRSAFSPEDHAGGWRGLRAGYERFLIGLDSRPVAASPVPPGLMVEGPEDGPVVLHVHGGGFMFGSARSSLGLAERIGRAIGGKVLTADYRLAPEHAYPAALEDVVAAYEWLLTEGVDPTRLIVTGESAGGGVALAAVRAVLDRGLPAPAAIWLLSPMADLALGAASIDEQDGCDPGVDRDLLTMMSGAYAQGRDPAEPALSPVHGSFAGFPPILLHAADNEALRDDSIRLRDAVRAAGGTAELHLVDDSVHIFAIFDYLPETRTALADLRSFVAAHVHDRTRA